MSKGASLRETGSRASTEPASSLGPSGFDPARYGLSEGAARALLRHTRLGGPLSDFVLGLEDAEELWFCSMLRATSGGKRLCTRTAWTSGISGGTGYSYELTEVGRAIRNAIAIETEGQDRDDGLGAEHESAGPKGIAKEVS